MKRFIWSLIGGLLLLGWCFPIDAADLKLPAKAAPLAAVASWEGLYLDAYFQYGANITGTTVTDGTTVADITGIPHGPGIGGALGYNFDTGAFVIGVRADVSYLDVTGSGQMTGPGGSLSLSNATNYLGNLDLLFGIPCSPDRKLLCYGVGGFAFGGAHPNLAAIGTSTSVSDTSTGWNIGAGLRYQLLPNLHVFIEGDFYKLGDRQLTLTDAAGLPILTSNSHYDIITQKGGVSFKF